MNTNIFRHSQFKINLVRNNMARSTFCFNKIDLENEKTWFSGKSSSQNLKLLDGELYHLKN